MAINFKAAAGKAQIAAQLKDILKIKSLLKN